MSLPLQPQSWTRDNFLISTDKSLLCLAAINTAFNEDFLYWTRAYPEAVLQQIINHSFCLGVYEQIEEKPQQIGFARLVTDNITFAYLTDVYILPQFQGRGLGGWLIDCLDELMRPLPHLRWFMLRTSSDKSRQSYEDRLDMHVLECGDASQGAIMMGRKGPANMA